MPSKRPQFNVRLSEDGEARFRRLEKVAKAVLGAEQSKAQIVEMALAALESQLAACERARKGEKK
jgi:hypothetical protein